MRWLIEQFVGAWVCIDHGVSPFYNGMIIVKQHTFTKRKKAIADFDISGRRDIPVERAEKLISEWKLQ